MRKTVLSFITAQILALAIPGAPAAQAEEEWTAEDYAKWDFERALDTWKGGFYGGLLFYYDGRGPLGRQWRESMDAADETGPRPEEWSVTSVECATETSCTATAIVKFTDEDVGGLRRYRLVREPGSFWGFVDEQRLKCPEGYRLQYQGICFNIADEQANDPAIEIRSAEPIAAD